MEEIENSTPKVNKVFKFQIGDLVFGWDTYRGIIGRISNQLEKGIHHANCYSIDIIKKTQPSFYVKRWDNERFWENEIELIQSMSETECVLKNGRVILIMSDNEILKRQQSTYPNFNKLINSFELGAQLLALTR